MSDLDASAPVCEAAQAVAPAQCVDSTPRVPSECEGTAGECSLNFTHRTAHGSAGDDDEASSGKYAQLAVQQLAHLKYKYPEVFEEPTYPVDRKDCPVNIEHEIKLADPGAAPPKRKIYPLDNVELEELKRQLGEFLESNRIRPSNSPYGSPILFARKKGGALRMCIDYRMLNQ